jgi:hypothetical protein
MGVPLFCILLGFLVGWYSVQMLAVRQRPIEQVLRQVLLYGVITSALTFVEMAIIWSPWLVLFFDRQANFANTGIPLILYEPKASFIGWLILMIVISPFLQLLTTLFSAHLALLNWAPARNNHALSPHRRR